MRQLISFVDKCGLRLLQSPRNPRRINALKVAFLHCSRTVPAKLTVTPVSSLVDQKNSISSTGLQPQQPVTFYAQLKGDDNVLFHSNAHYIANESGLISLSEQPSQGGTYTGIHSMGLLWSLQPGPGERRGSRLLKRDVTTPYEVKLKVFHDHLKLEDCINSKQAAENFLSECSFYKWYMESNVQRIPVRDGRVRGTLFLPPGDGPFPGVIEMLGTVGGLYEFKAALLASHGFASLALAYFNYDDLPPTFKFLEMEYFEEALEWMCKHPQVLHGGIGLHASSLGAVIAMTLASFRSEVSAVVAAATYYGFPPTSEISHRGKILKTVDFNMDKIIMVNGDIGVLKNCSGNLSADEIGIDMENIQGEILLVGGEDDQLINTSDHYERLMERLQKHGKDFTLLSYQGAGHLIEPPYTPLCSYIYNTELLKMFMMMGGETVSHARAQEHYWIKTIDFLRMNIPRQV